MLLLPERARGAKLAKRIKQSHYPLSRGSIYYNIYIYIYHPLYGSLRRIVEPTLFAGLCRPPRGSWRDSCCAKTISEKFLTDPCSPRVDLSWGTNIFKIDKS